MELSEKMKSLLNGLSSSEQDELVAKAKAMQDAEAKNAEEKSADRIAEKVGDVIAESLKSVLGTVETKAIHGDDKGGAGDEVKSLTELKAKAKGSGEEAKRAQDEVAVKFLKAVAQKDYTAVKALSEGTASDGGYLVPNEFRAQIIRDVSIDQALRSFATVIPMSKDVMDIPSLSSSVSVSWGTENTEIGTTGMGFGNIQLAVNRLNAILKTSRELLDDASIEVLGLVRQLFAEAIRTEENAKIMAGTGSGQPKGIDTETITGDTSVGTLTADDILTSYYDLPAVYRANAVWIGNNDVLQVVAKLKDGNNDYIFHEPTTGGLPTLKGRPFIECAGVASGKLFLGDMRYYLFGDRQQMTIETTTEGAGTFEKHQTAVKVIERVDGELGLTNAFRELSGITVS